ncbi:MAG TPA: hypothetical protein VIL74_08965 [Pyrinomonadaceae bacterium]|jgi:hypothetical protein
MEDEGIRDFRDSKDFKRFKRELLEFVEQEKSVTWRRLAERFIAVEQSHYWITLAVESLELDKLTVEREKIPELIRLKEKKNMQKTRITPEIVERLASEGLTRAQAAERIGVASGSMDNAYYTKPEIKAAWLRGQTQRQVKALTKPSEPQKFAGCSKCGKQFTGFPKHISRDNGALCDDCETAPVAEIVPSSVKIAVLEGFEAPAVSEPVKNLLKKVRAEFIYMEAWGEPSPHCAELVAVIERAAQ